MKRPQYVRDEKVVIRTEYFGGIGFQRSNGITLEFDEEAYVLLSLLSKPLSLFQIRNTMEQRFTRKFSPREITYLIEKFVDHGFVHRENRRIVHPWDSVQPRENETWHELLSAPEVVHFSVTSKCNMDCPFCYRGDTKDMSTEQITGLIDELARMRVFQLAIGGGEPLLRKDLTYIIDYCYKKNIVPNLTINGTLLNDSFLKNVSGKVGQINISFNAHFVREGIDNTETIFLLDQYGIRSGINLLITHRSVPNLGETLFRLSELPVQNITILRPHPCGNREWYRENQLREGDLKLIRHSLSKYNRVRVDCSLTCLMRQVPGEVLQRNAVYGCTAGVRFCTVGSDGRVFPCSFFQDANYEAGNITKQNFKEIWTRSKVFRKFRTMTDKIQGICRNCEIKNYCKGCRRIALEHGNFYAGERLCGG